MAQRRAPEGAREHPRGRDDDQADVTGEVGDPQWPRQVAEVFSNRRPLHHRRADRVRAHVLLCMLAYCVKWHMLRVLAPMLFDDHHRPPPTVSALRRSLLRRVRQRRGPRLADNAPTTRCPLHSSRTLLADLGTLTRQHRCRSPRRQHLHAAQTQPPNPRRCSTAYERGGR